MKVGIIAHTLESARKTIEYDAEFDAYEIRVDTIQENLSTLLETVRSLTAKPLILTLRSLGHGGSYQGSPYFLLQLAQFFPKFLDVEYDIPDDVVAQIPQDIQIIASYHNFEETPTDLPHIVEQLQSRPSVRYKIACMPQSVNDVMRLFEVAQKNESLTVISMGKLGAFSRIIAPVFGDMLQFIAVAGHSAPGQLSLQELLQVYNYNHISQRTRIYALLGDPVDKSYSHITHNQVFRHLGVDAVYVKIQVKKEELGEFLHRAKALPFYGFSITMPLKRHFSFDPVNTLRREEDHWHTRNTDGVGALNAIEREIEVKDKTVLILGAGGASHAIAQEAINRGAHVKIANRTLEKAHALSLHLGGSCVAGSLDDPTFCKTYDILINCTPTGMIDGKSPIPPSWILPGTVIMDSISNPRRTPLLREAERMDCTAISGLEMFLLQAVEQFLFWFPELKNDASCIERILRESLPSE